jgi:hypothetical protein
LLGLAGVRGDANRDITDLLSHDLFDRGLELFVVCGDADLCRTNIPPAPTAACAQDSPVFSPWLQNL